MTHEEAVREVEAYKEAVNHYLMKIALAGIVFGTRAEHCEEALGLKPGDLFQALTEIDLLNTGSRYMAVLENATKGQLKSTPEVDFFDRNNEVIIDG